MWKYNVETYWNLKKSEKGVRQMEDQLENLVIGIQGEKEEIVTAEKTALAMGSGKLAVYATPSMVALMEGAAVAALEDKLAAHMDTVGSRIEIMHLSATPLDMKVKAVASLIDIDGKKLTFEVEAFDEREKIGSGIHQRYIINPERFMERCTGKKEV